MTIPLSQNHLFQEYDLLQSPLEENALTLSEKYRHLLDSPDLFFDTEKFFEIRDAVEKIENILQHFSIKDAANHRLQISAILKSEDHLQVIRELGMALFYLDRDQSLPTSQSLLSLYAEEIMQEMDLCLDQHKSVGAPSLIPSGKTHCLMQAFARMALTSRQVFNKGGVYAIRGLLNNPTFKIVLHLEPEHRHHILSAVNALLSNPAFEALIERHTSIHPDLEDLIRLDLKLAPDHPVSSTFIIYDALISLFVDIRQKEEPNCYAIAALIYAIENEPLRYFEKTLQWLKQGYVSMNKHYTLPIHPLIEKRILYINDLKCKISFEDAAGLAPFQRIGQAFNIAIKIPVETTPPMEVGQVLSNMLKGSNHLSYAEHMYLSYKSNTLVLAHLAVCELTHINTCLEAPCQKKEFLDSCLEAIKESHSLTKQYPKDFLEKFSNRLSGIIWLENCNEQKVEVYTPSVTVRARKIHHFAGDCLQLASIFKRSLRIFTFDGQTYKLIDRISDLQKTLTRASQETANLFEEANQRQYQATSLSLSQIVSGAPFKEKIANYCAQQLNQNKIQGVHLKKADLLLLNQKGGTSDKVLDLVYGISVKKVSIKGNTTPYQLMNQLIKALPGFDSHQLLSTKRVLLFTPGHHAWTLNPYNWRHLMDNQRSFSSFIQETIFDRVKLKLAKQLPYDIICHIIERFTASKAVQKKLLDAFPPDTEISYFEFPDRFSGLSTVKNKKRAKEITETAYAEIWMTKQILSKTLKSLDIQLSSSQFHELYNSLPLTGTLPYILSRRLRERLIEFGIAIHHPYDIEHALCTQSNEPLSFPIGDSNWLQQHTENPYHVELCIGYRYQKNSLVFKSRYKDSEKIRSNSDYWEVEIQHPII